MDVLYSDGASAQVGQKAKEIMRSFVIDDWASEPHNPNQNFAERAWRDTKRNVNATMNMTGAPANTWLLALNYVIYVMNRTAIANLNWRTPYKKMWGVTPDISAMLEYHFYEPVYYKTLKPRFPKDSTEQQVFSYGVAAAGLAGAGLAVFALWPTAVPRFDVDWSRYPAFEFLHSVDASGNACPSLHVAFAVFTACWFARFLRQIGAGRFPRTFNWLWCAGILYSTIATRQHVALDVLAGSVLGATAAVLHLRWA
jgi:membrane-associated phospholipid phosphatase